MDPIEIYRATREFLRDRWLSKLSRRNRMRALVAELRFNEQLLSLFDLKEALDDEEWYAVAETLRVGTYESLISGGFDFEVLHDEQATQKLHNVYTRLQVLVAHSRLKARLSEKSFRSIRTRLRWDNLKSDVGELARVVAKS